MIKRNCVLNCIMKIESDIKLDFIDVLIRPKRSTLSTRSEVSMIASFLFQTVVLLGREYQLSQPIWIQLVLSRCTENYQSIKLLLV